MAGHLFLRSLIEDFQTNHQIHPSFLYRNDLPLILHIVKLTPSHIAVETTNILATNYIVHQQLSL